jgi:hypothetical protein
MRPPPSTPPDPLGVDREAKDQQRFSDRTFAPLATLRAGKTSS